MYQNNKIVELFFGKDKNKCQRWHDIVKKIQRKHSNSVDSVVERSDSFGKLKGLDDDVKVVSDISQLSKTMPKVKNITKEEVKEKMQEITSESITINSKQKPKNKIKEEIKENNSKQFKFDLNEESSILHKDFSTQCINDTVDIYCETDRIYSREAGVSTIDKRMI